MNCDDDRSIKEIVGHVISLMPESEPISPLRLEADCRESPRENELLTFESLNLGFCLGFIKFPLIMTVRALQSSGG